MVKPLNTAWEFNGRNAEQQRTLQEMITGNSQFFPDIRQSLQRSPSEGGHHCAITTGIEQQFRICHGDGGIYHMTFPARGFMDQQQMGRIPKHHILAVVHPFFHQEKVLLAESVRIDALSRVLANAFPKMGAETRERVPV